MRLPVWRCVVLAWCAAALCSANAGALLPGTVLPDGRGYELVSPASKNGGRITAAGVSPDGQRVNYAIVQAPSPGTSGLFLSTQTASGWSARNVMPPADQLLFVGNYDISAWTRSLSVLFVVAHPGLSTSGDREGSLLRLDGVGGQSVVQAFPPGGGINSVGLVASADGSHVFANVTAPFDPGHVPGTFNVYDFGGGSPVLVDRLPDGSVPTCGASGAGGVGFADFVLGSSVVQHWISVDGSRVFFVTPGDVCDGSVPPELYMRDRTAGSTTLVSGPAIAGPEMPATFLGANADGSQVAYVTAAQLTPDDTNSDPDVYRYTSGPGGGNACLTCLVPDASVLFTATTGAGVAVSEDLSHVYFTSTSQLVPGKGTAGVANLYVWHKDSVSGAAQIDWVSPRPFPRVSNNPSASANGELTPDGNVLLFSSRDAGMDALTPGQTNGGFLEAYRYDDRVDDPAKRMTCISCPLNGATPTTDTSAAPFISSNANVSDQRIMADDGNTIVFRTREPLVREDINGTDDIYEWRDGQITLIGDGVTPQSLVDADQITGISAGGDDILFTSFSRLTAGVLDHSNQLYDAKIGAVPPPAPPAPPCSGESCQDPPGGAPALHHPGSVTYTGPGNVVARIGVAHITAGQRRTFARTGRLTLAIGVTQPGRISITGHGAVGRHPHTLTTPIARIARHPGVVRATLRLTSIARDQLRKGHLLHIAVTVRYSKVAAPQRIVLTLKIKTAAKGGHR